MVGHECTQKTAIALLTKDKDNMAKDINEIKGDVKQMKNDMNLIKEHILTAPLKYADKKEFDNFKKWIDSKIAYISWWAIVISTIWWFLINKFL